MDAAADMHMPISGLYYHEVSTDMNVMAYSLYSLNPYYDPMSDPQSFWPA